MKSWDTTATVTIEELSLDQSRLPERVRRDRSCSRIDMVEIVFRSIGHYQPASMYGGPDGRGWPAEGEDERTMESLKAFNEAGQQLPLFPEDADAIFESFSKEIHACELPRDEGREWDE